MKVHDKHHPEVSGSTTTGTSSVKSKGNVGKGSAANSSSSLDSELGSAKVNLSDRAQDMKKIREKIDSAADVDEAKVAKFKKLIASGQYKVDSKAVADKIVDEHAYNDLFKVETEE